MTSGWGVICAAKMTPICKSFCDELHFLVLLTVVNISSLKLAWIKEWRQNKTVKAHYPISDRLYGLSLTFKVNIQLKITLCTFKINIPGHIMHVIPNKKYVWEIHLGIFYPNVQYCLWNNFHFLLTSWLPLTFQPLAYSSKHAKRPQDHYTVLYLHCSNLHQ